MKKNLFIEDIQSGQIRVHKTVQESLRHHAAYNGESVPQIRTKKQLCDAFASALAGASLAEVERIARKNLE